MKKKYLPSPRNPQDIIDDTYNARDFEIENKDMNAYVMPLDMVRDVDAFDAKYFYEEEWQKIMKGE
ncbi:hypothetical protein CACET_c03790 [Clostridium aceticum]|uniref:Uncharacterized protein n=1 Tax=Clostridium aceticum TaxID=84022 RepID=A0A0D8IEL3_9CLOT|nr:hypothetical protein [Clostridium aceticum]AKL93895.1 hypothetical protein CACET_c03790 [Clostridium aceticum]KJF28713.1 hypothetical protein TZ02_02095 [Clostridium aceticum]